MRMLVEPVWTQNHSLGSGLPLSLELSTGLPDQLESPSLARLPI